MIRKIRNNKWLILYLIIGMIVTFYAREYAVNRRLSMGLTPSWGGEFLIIPLMIILYAAVKADWSVS